MRLYDFHKDNGKISSCYGQCAEAWPPLLTNGSPKAMGGAKSSVLGTTKRKDGTTQVTYKGHPLYGFIEDKNQANPTATASTASAACGSRSIRTAQRPLAERSLWGKDL
jgi:predicted lipoprotein with Yx(FWY)xxD motif